MPALQNAQYEAFAMARAKGARLDDAYEDAGFTPCGPNACRMAHRPEVAARIAELRRELAEAQDASPQAILAGLVRLAKASEELKSAVGLKEARLHLIEAYRIQADVVHDRVRERASPSSRI
jgi:hypothetical protein